MEAHRDEEEKDVEDSIQGSGKVVHRVRQGNRAEPAEGADGDREGPEQMQETHSS